MLIQIQDYVKNGGVDIRGILHIGAHECEEKEYYKQCFGDVPVVWVEANPVIANKMSSNNVVENFAVSDVDDHDVELNVANNGQSSSLLDMKEHLIMHPGIEYVAKVRCKTITIKTLVEKYKNVKFDLINLDIQGMEYVALCGAGDLLKDVKFIYTEVNFIEIYKDCGLIGKIDTLLQEYGFDRVATADSGCGWGDALYVNQSIIGTGC